uniref:Sigma-70 family RNA polymerase sigma factor n=1 Tax=Desulfobacca acetoxidans TaxID=60893 RepID=A0A7C5EN33_9BACT
MSNEAADLDYALLRRLARGEVQALEELIRRHERRLFQLAYRLLKDYQEAEDALQEVFLKVYEHARDFQPRSTVRAWMNRITANHCLNRLRERQPLTSLDEENAPSLQSLEATPLEVLEEADLARKLEELLAALPENQRRALILKRFGHLSYQEIAEAMEITPDAVDGLIKRARRFLRLHLKDYFSKDT